VTKAASLKKDEKQFTIEELLPPKPSKMATKRRKPKKASKSSSEKNKTSNQKDK